jgi:hypothetical protein
MPQTIQQFYTEVCECLAKEHDQTIKTNLLYAKYLCEMEVSGRTRRDPTLLEKPPRLRKRAKAAVKAAVAQRDIRQILSFRRHPGRMEVEDDAVLKACRRLQPERLGAPQAGMNHDLRCRMIVEIKNLHFTTTSKYYPTASFYRCKNLTVATGTYPGPVKFNHSGIEEIRDLEITSGDYPDGLENVLERCSA